jgi:hypothetical protein
MKKLKIKITFHSMVDVITNSSSEIFCQIKSKEFLEEIALYLTEILGREIEYCDDCDEDDNSIDFWIEYGDYDYLTDDFSKLLNIVLSEKFGKENYTISTDVPM